MDDGDPLHQRDRVVDQRLSPDAERGVRAERLHEQRHPEVAAGLERSLAREDGVARIENVLEGEQLLGESLVLAQVELARSAAGVANAEQLEQAGDGDVAEDVVTEHLHQVEDEVGLAAGQAGDEALDVTVDAEDRDPVPQPAKGPRHLGDDGIVLFRVLVLAVEIGQHGDLH